MVKSVFHLSLRATQGFLESVVRLMEISLPVSGYSTVSRRQAELGLGLGPLPTEAPRHLVIDSTGLKVHGEGKWHVRKHGMRSGRRRTWRKLHLGMDEATKELVAVDLTASTVHDSHQPRGMSKRTPGNVVQVSGDKAYDSRACYEAILR